MKISTSKSSTQPGIGEEKPAHRKPNYFSTGLFGVNISWSFVMHSTLLSAKGSPAGSSSTHSWTSSESSGSRSESRSSSSGVSSRSDARTSSCSLPRKSLWSFGWRKHNKRDKSPGEKNSALVMEKLPFSESGKYLTVYVGVRDDQIVKYVIRRSLVTHPLFQVMLKISEDEFGNEYAVNGGVPIVCDPDLFLEVVRAVDGNLDSILNAESETITPLQNHDEPGSSLYIETGSNSCN